MSKIRKPTMIFGMNDTEQKQLERIMKLDEKMRSVDFSIAVIDALIWDMAEEVCEVEMQSTLNEIMERAYGGAE